MTNVTPERLIGKLLAGGAPAFCCGSPTRAALNVSVRVRGVLKQKKAISQRRCSCAAQNMKSTVKVFC